nr:hypothetical protein CFP56_57479 [Quercus suber]
MKPSSHCQVRANHMVSQSESFSGSEGEGPQQTLKRKSNQTPPLLGTFKIHQLLLLEWSILHVWFVTLKEHDVDRDLL